MAEMTYVLAEMFALLASNGFGDTQEDKTEDIICEEKQDASGPGMTEGKGEKDVSDKIDDENQIVGTADKKKGTDVSDEEPTDKDMGIDMQMEFDAKPSDIDDLGEDDLEDEGNVDMEDEMGSTPDSGQVVDEKSWDKGKDGNSPDTSIDKYESGPSVKEMDNRCREFRAKEDNALAVEKSREMDTNKSDRLTEKDKETDNAADDESITDMNLDKDKAYEDPSEIQFNEQEQNLENISIDEPQGSNILEEPEAGPTGSDEEMKDEDGKSNPADHSDDENHMQVDETMNIKEGGEDIENSNTDLKSRIENFDSDRCETFEYPGQGADSAQPASDLHSVNSSTEPEVRQPISTNMNYGLAPSRNLPSNDVPMMDLPMPDSSNGSMHASDLQKPETSRGESSSVQRIQTNPYRSIGDAMKEWKERVNISVDPQDHNSRTPDDIEDKNADDYRYVSKAEEGTSQALGAAEFDQIKNNIEGNKLSADEDHIRNRDNSDRMDLLKENSETPPKTSQVPVLRQKIDEELLEIKAANDASMEEIQKIDSNSSPGNIVSFETSYVNEKVLLPSTVQISEESSERLNNEGISNDTKQNAISDWRKYEPVTTKLSQELAEQLRLVMEPTLASKLQGDYRTGKRINMKKVIAYIASQFRKDKIWLRRTRPNKRDYQVVVAVDDSSSMSENQCGHFAVKALLTVCQAISQLEIGQFAVASFGKKGNVRLIHEFDQPFNGQAGIKMISSLSFKQENTIEDNPVVELLSYLNNMLDNAVAKARMPSGQNPLQQLILIISDGRFHEKDKLKRCVRDILSRKRMVAFIVLDNPERSIMDILEPIYGGPTVTFSKIMNSFPFPHYIVLRNIEALPRTLADLLRQWFELMQRISE